MKDKNQAENKAVTKEQYGFFGGPAPAKDEPKKDEPKKDEVADESE